MAGNIRVGMVGLDTSLCSAFTRILNDAEYQYYLPGARVTAAFPGGSEGFSKSRDRVEAVAAELQENFGIPMIDNLKDLIDRVDAVLLESVDGRQHLEQFRELAAGKPVFIDKPFVTSTADARDILEIAERTSTPLMSSSSVRLARTQKSGSARLLHADGKNRGVLSDRHIAAGLQGDVSDHRVPRSGRGEQEEKK